MNGRTNENRGTKNKKQIGTSERIHGTNDRRYMEQTNETAVDRKESVAQTNEIPERDEVVARTNEKYGTTE